jgi:hypothetical protein
VFEWPVRWGLSDAKGTERVSCLLAQGGGEALQCVASRLVGVIV